MSSQPQKIFLKDYQAPEFEVKNLDLHFELFEEFSLVHSKMTLIRKNASANRVFFDGENLELVSCQVNQKPAQNMMFLENGLTFDCPGTEFQVEITTKIKPQENTALEGLYKSSDIFCTQCEAQGFRKITYFFDRPDVMTTYTVRIDADEKKYPVLLSNGNRIRSEKLSEGRHSVIWQDPFKKPCYLFAMVAGDLGLLKDQFTTKSGRRVDLEIYARHGYQDRCTHAMESLKKSMKWDEERFGREYDLDVYMILAVDDFNAGAMENKGLNIFNSRLIFANPATATDQDYFQIESVVAHEYFHNWTGNRVTLRDWFHLSLKEGLTVFRDQEFSMDQSSRGMIRIENVSDLRDYQFSEDAGPNAHPIRPASCYAVDNFFTATIYEKGSEVIRMMQTMVGRPGFRKGMDLYFERFDGKAVIIEDFAQAISEANGQNWDQFKLWYSQGGTPKVKMTQSYDPAQKELEITLSQSCEPTALEKAEHKTDPNWQKKEFHIPLVFGLLDPTGKELPVDCNSAEKNSEGQFLLHLKQKQQKFTFKNLAMKPVVSMNRQFSAPIHLEDDLTEADNLFLMKHDTDSFNQWEAAQKIYKKIFLEKYSGQESAQFHDRFQNLKEAFRSVLKNSLVEPDMKSALMSLPSLDYLIQMIPNFDGPRASLTMDNLLRDLALFSKNDLIETYLQWHGKNSDLISNLEISRRKLKNKCLSLLSQISGEEKYVIQQFRTAKTMTDQQAALQVLVDLEIPERIDAIDSFFHQWKNESLVLNKWFGLQAISSHPDTFDRIQKLIHHPDFSMKNPNRVYSLLGTFGGNFAIFHNPELPTYDFMSEKIKELDRLNPQVAARVAGCFDVWTMLTEKSRKLAQKSLESLVSANLSANTSEILKNALNAGENILKK